MPIVDRLGTADRRAPAHGPGSISRRRVLLGLAGLPAGLALASCTGSPPLPVPSGPTTSGAQAPTPTPTPPVLDGPVLVAAAAAARQLIATYEATIATHPSLDPVLAPYAADHDVHLDALGERVALPTPPVRPGPPTSTVPPAITGPTGSTSTPPKPPTPTSVPADPAAARGALAGAELVAGEAAASAARDARDGEAARLLASIAASRAVHALLLGVPA